mmetsp:Transcript_5105/g.21699  ORF Transcript_5105/g.21699 Transcript_5105/m.21699 type:complete len:242 (+) Transcript_5105:454-1179(+)
MDRPVHRGARQPAEAGALRDRAGGAGRASQETLHGRAAEARQRLAGVRHRRPRRRRGEKCVLQSRVAVRGGAPKRQAAVRDGRRVPAGSCAVYGARRGHVRLRVSLAHGAVRHRARARGRAAFKDQRHGHRLPPDRREVRLFRMREILARAPARRHHQGAARRFPVDVPQHQAPDASVQRNARGYFRKKVRQIRARIRARAVPGYEGDPGLGARRDGDGGDSARVSFLRGLIDSYLVLQPL